MAVPPEMSPGWRAANTWPFIAARGAIPFRRVTSQMKIKIPSSGYFSNGLPYVRSGKGPKPLVIFQGLLFENKPQSGMTFGYGFLKKDYTLYAVLRKTGLPQGYTLKDMADDYAEMIRQEFNGPVDVIGVSTGGSLAQHFAADHPNLLRRLVIHSSAHTLGKAGKQIQLEIGRLAQAGRVAQAWQAMIRFGMPSTGIWKFLNQPLAWTAAQLLSLGPKPDLSDLVVTIKTEDQHAFKDRLAEIKSPTLVIAGEDDPFYSPDLFRETAAGIPHARLALFENMRHPAMGKQFERDVLAFLREE
jgi:pimeloyl-ACP methyl ester carboxylesterase